MEVDLSNTVKLIFVFEIVMEFQDGSLRRFVKFWIATTITLFLLLVLASQRWPTLDAMMPSPSRATKQNSGNSNEVGSSLCWSHFHLVSLHVSIWCVAFRHFHFSMKTHMTWLNPIYSHFVSLFLVEIDPMYYMVYFFGIGGWLFYSPESSFCASGILSR